MSKPQASRNGRHQPRPGAARGTDTTRKTTGLGGDARAASRTPQEEDRTLDAKGSSTAVILTEGLVRALVEESPDGIVLVDGSAGIVLVNRQIEQLFGYDRTELLGAPIEILVPSELRQAHRSHRAAFDRDPRSRPMGLDLDLSGQRRDGSTFPVEVSLTPLGAPTGSVVIATVRDITERRAAARAQLELSRLRAVEAILALHRGLTGAVFQGQGVTGLARAVHNVTGRAVTVEDVDGTILGWAGPQPPEHSPSSPSVLRQRGRDVGHAHAFRDGERLVAVARPDGEILGAISIIDPNGDATEADTIALEQAATVLAMELFRLRSMAETELKVWGDLTSELLDGTDLDRSRLHAQTLGYDIDRPHRAILIERTDNALIKMLPPVRRAARHLGIDTALMTARTIGVVVLVDHDAGWAELACEIAQEGGGTHRIGVGGRHGPEDLRRSLDEAKLALRLTAIPGGGPAAIFDDLGVWRFLAADADPAGLEALVQHWIGPLLDYDAAHAAELVKTLVAYLEGGGVLEATSARLHIHRSTLKYRLGRIRDLTGWDLRDSEQRFNIDLACRAHATLGAPPNKA